MIYSYHLTAYSDRYFSSIKHRLLSPRLHASINSSCIAKLGNSTYNLWFIHNYFLSSRFVMQDGIFHRIFKSKNRFCVLSSSTSDSSSYHYTFQCIGLSQRLFIAICCNGFFYKLPLVGCSPSSIVGIQ